MTNNQPPHDGSPETAANDPDLPTTIAAWAAINRVCCAVRLCARAYRLAYSVLLDTQDAEDVLESMSTLPQPNRYDVARRVPHLAPRSRPPRRNAPQVAADDHAGASADARRERRARRCPRRGYVEELQAAGRRCGRCRPGCARRSRCARAGADVSRWPRLSMPAKDGRAGSAYARAASQGMSAADQAALQEL